MFFAIFSLQTYALGKQTSWAHSGNLLLCPARLRVQTLRYAQRVWTAYADVLNCTTLAERTRRAFHQIFRDFWVNRVGIRCLMHFYAFLKRKLHCCNASSDEVQNWQLIRLQRRKGRAHEQFCPSRRLLEQLNNGVAFLTKVADRKAT